MIQADFGALVVAFVAAMGIPSAVMGVIVWFMKRRIDKKDKETEKKTEAQQELMILLVKSTRASIALSEATAHAIQHGHTNGDMEAALTFATAVKNEQKDFLAEQGIQNIFDD